MYFSPENDAREERQFFHDAPIKNRGFIRSLDDISVRIDSFVTAGEEYLSL